MTSPFAYLRRRVCEAVLSGFGDALEQIDHAAPPDLSDAARRLEARLTPALPAPDERKGRRKDGGA